MMSIQFNMSDLVPRFLFNDLNGHAIAKAIERCWVLAAQAAEEGLSLMNDPDSMPEWRLDELASEYDIPYDYKADVETKRTWIKDASEQFRLFGTPEGIRRYIQAYFSDVTLLEAADYEGEPFHFKLDISGVWTTEKQDWVVKAVETVKNVRSVLDSMVFHLPEVRSDWHLFAGIGLYGASTHHFAATEQPDVDNEEWLGDEAESVLMDENSSGMTD